MQNDYMSSFGAFNEAGMTSVRQLGELQMRAFERFGEHQLAVANDFLTGGLRQFETMTDVRDPRAGIAEHSKAVAELNEKLVAHTRKSVELVTELRDDLAEWAKSGMENASEIATPADKKPARARAKTA